MSFIITVKALIILVIDRLNDRPLPIHKKYLLIPNRINKFVGRHFREKFSSPGFKQLFWNLINTWRFIDFYLFSNHLIVKMHSAPKSMVLLTPSDINSPFY
jgi:hypothetical protein